MSKKMSEDEIREIATHRVRRRRGFYSHLTAYILVNLMLVAIWYFTGRRLFLAQVGDVVLGNRANIQCRSSLCKK